MGKIIRRRTQEDVEKQVRRSPQPKTGDYLGAGKGSRAGPPLFLQRQAEGEGIAAPAEEREEEELTSTEPAGPDSLQRQIEVGATEAPLEEPEEEEGGSTAPAGSASLQRQVEGEEEPLEELEEESGVRAKLTIGQKGDEYEQEADQVADTVARAPEIGSEVSSVNNLASEEEEERPTVQPKVDTGASRTATAQLRRAVRSPGPGAPMSDRVRERIEPVLGADLGHVRVHEDAGAARAAKSIRAKAFTHKDHIWLGRGQSPEDANLMAHEATHVVQQTAKGPTVQRDEASTSMPLTVSIKELSTWTTENLIREFISLPQISSVHRDNVLSLIKRRLRYRSSLEELRSYETLVLREGASDMGGATELLDFIASLVSLMERRKSAIGLVETEYFNLQPGILEVMGTPTSSPEHDVLERRFAWREKVLMATRPTRKWVLLHRGLIEELHIRYETAQESTMEDPIIDKLFQQQALLIWALEQDIIAIEKKMDEIEAELYGTEPLMSKAPTFEEEPLSVCSPESEERRRKLWEKHSDIGRERAEELEELALLKRSFSMERWHAVHEKYVHPRGGCMRALYRGLGVMFTPEESKKLETGIMAESRAYARRMGNRLCRKAPEWIRIVKNLDDPKKCFDWTAGTYRNVDRMMKNLAREGKAGRAVSTYYDKTKKRYDPSLRELVLSLVSRDRMGRYFFGVSLHSGYHTVGLAVEVSIDKQVTIYWLDQHIHGGFVPDNDVSKESAMNDQVYKPMFRPDYGYKRITVWPIIPAEAPPEPEALDWSLE